jgi:hypothetical protein
LLIELYKSFFYRLICSWNFAHSTPQKNKDSHPKVTA